jgi:hypothetical protein
MPLPAQKPLPVDGQVGLRITPKISGGPKSGTGAQISYKKPGQFRRVIRDWERNPLFAYEIEIATTGGGTYQITAKPASAEFAQSFQNGSLPRLNSAPSVPTLNATSTVNCFPGGSVTLDLLYNPSTGQKITDTITLVDLNADVRGTPMDGTLRFHDLEFRLNETNLTPSPIGIGGHSVYIYVPGRGGFFFALDQPQEYSQFQKVGFVDGKRLRFTWANQSYEVISTEPILSNAGSAEVWVFVDPYFRPELGVDAPSAGSSKSMKPFLSKDELENQ